MKTQINEKALQIANSFMPFILHGVASGAQTEIRDAMAKTIQSAISDEETKRISAEVALDMVLEQRDNLHKALSKVIADHSILNDASAHWISKKYPVTPEVQARADRYAEIINALEYTTP